MILKKTGHLNISDTALTRIKKYGGKKIKDIAEKEKKTKHFLKIKMVFLSLKNLHLM